MRERGARGQPGECWAADWDSFGWTTERGLNGEAARGEAARYAMHSLGPCSAGVGPALHQPDVCGHNDASRLVAARQCCVHAYLAGSLLQWRSSGSHSSFFGVVIPTGWAAFFFGFTGAPDYLLSRRHSNDIGVGGGKIGSDGAAEGGTGAQRQENGERTEDEEGEMREDLLAEAGRGGGGKEAGSAQATARVLLSYPEWPRPD